MEYRLLGRTGLKVSTFGFGTMSFGGVGRFAGTGDTTGEEARRQIDMCIEAGVNLFDTSDAYSAGRSEEELAQALGNRRNWVLIATKCYFATGRGVNDRGANRRHIIRTCEASLRRLKTDFIDLYQIHGQDRQTPPEETLRAMDDLVRQGKVRYIGSSNYSGWFMMKSLAVSDRLGTERFASQQIQYSLLHRDAENELLPLAVEEGVGSIIWSPLATGYLSGKFKHGEVAAPTRLAHHGWLDKYQERGPRIVAELEAIASTRPGASASQVALNWAARRAGVSSILLGARTADQLAGNLAAASWSLTDEEVRRLDEVSATPLPYPYDIHQTVGLGAERDAPLQLQPPIRAPAD